MNDLKFTTAGDYMATPSMNTVLARLSQETDVWCDQNWSDHLLYDVYWEEHFAQLIVQECANICDKIYFDRYPDAEDFERSEEGDAIKKHFGVEE